MQKKIISSVLAVGVLGIGLFLILSHKSHLESHTSSSNAEIREIHDEQGASSNSAAVAPDSSNLSILDDVREQETARSTKAAQYGKRFLEQLQYPLEYDGKPASSTLPENVEAITEVHRRYWANYAKVAGIDFRYRRYTVVDGRNTGGEGWDMDAHIAIKPGESMTVEGKTVDGIAFTASVNNEGESQSFTDARSWVSLMQDISRIRQAKPEFCAIFSDIKRDQRFNDTDPSVYDVLIAKGSGIRNPEQEIDIAYWYNHATGMLEHIVWHDEEIKTQFGCYPQEDYEYVHVSDVYWASKIVSDMPHARYKLTETCEINEIIERSN